MPWELVVGVMLRVCELGMLMSSELRISFIIRDSTTRDICVTLAMSAFSAWEVIMLCMATPTAVISTAVIASAMSISISVNPAWPRLELRMSKFLVCPGVDVHRHRHVEARIHVAGPAAVDVNVHL